MNLHPQKVRRAIVAAVVSAGVSPMLVAGIGPTSVAGATAPAGPCDGIDAGEFAEMPALEAMQEIDSLTAFSAAVLAAGLDDELAVASPVTVFAASNDAIDAIPQNVFDTLLADTDLLASLISYHIVGGQSLDVAALASAGSADTLNGPVTLTTAGATLRVNDSAVLCGDIVTADGVIHVIDRVLQPPTDAIAGCTGSSVPGSSAPASSTPGSSVPC